MTRTSSLDRCADDAIDAFGRRHGATPAACAVAPGRVNLIGDHVDYLGGPVLPMPIDLGIAVALDRAGARDTLSIDAAAVGLSGAFAIGASRSDRDGDDVAAIALIERALRGDGAEARDDATSGGWRIVVHATLPPGAGLSSSAALAIAVLDARDHALGITRSPDERIALARAIEHDATGVPCGTMDQTAIVRGGRDAAMLLDCATGRIEPIPLPAADDAIVATIDSGESRRLGAGAYAERRARLEAATARFGIASWTDVPVEIARRIDRAADGGDPIDRAARHALTECRRVLDAATALRANDHARTGALLSESHASLRDDLDVSTDRLDAIVDRLRAVDGVRGARLTGAGFGGAVVALLRPDALDDAVRTLDDAGLGRIRRVRAIGGARRRDVTR